jgi:hypothetical protein
MLFVHRQMQRITLFVLLLAVFTIVHAKNKQDLATCLAGCDTNFTVCSTHFVHTIMLFTYYYRLVNW